MNIVTLALYNPPLSVPPMTVRTFLAYRMSLMTIMRVRRTLSESEIEKYGIVAQLLPIDTEPGWSRHIIPITTLMTLALGVAARSWRP